MPIASGVIFRVRVDGADTNGGGFVPGSSGTDYSDQAAAQYSLTGLTSSGAGNTLLTTHASADMVGNVAYCSAGTNAKTADWYQIASVVVGTSITFSTGQTNSDSIATGVASGVAIAIGGAFETPGIVSLLLNVSNTLITVAFKAPANPATPFVITSATVGSGGLLINAGNNVGLRIIGYQNVIGDTPISLPIIRWTGSAPGSATYMLVQCFCVQNLIIDANNTTFVGGIQNGQMLAPGEIRNASDSVNQMVGCAGSEASGIKISNCYIGVGPSNTEDSSGSQAWIDSCTIGLQGAFFTNGGYVDCLVTNCLTGAQAGSNGGLGLVGCTIDGSSVVGIDVSACFDVR